MASQERTTTQRLHEYLRGDMAAMAEQLEIMERAASELRSRLSSLALIADDLQGLEDAVAVAVPIIHAVAADLWTPCMERVPGTHGTGEQCELPRGHEERHRGGGWEWTSSSLNAVKVGR